MMVLRLLIVACFHMILAAAYMDDVMDTGVYVSFTIDLVIAWILVEVVIELRK